MIKTVTDESIGFNPLNICTFKEDGIRSNKIITMNNGQTIEISEKMWRYAKHECNVGGLSLLRFDELKFTNKY